MRTSFMPSTDGGMLDFGRNLKEHLQPDGSAYGLSTAQYTEFEQRFDLYESCYHAAKNKSTRTQAKIAAKNDARVQLRQVISKIALIIRGQFDISDEQLIELGLPPHDREPTPIEVPPTRPQLTLTPRGPRSVHVLIRDELAPDRRAKPFGVSGAAIFTHVGGEEAPASLDDWKQWGSTSRTSIEISFPDAPAGATVWTVACWMNPRFQTGPASLPVSVVLNAGGVVKAS